MNPALTYLPFVFALILSTALTYLTIIGYRKLGLVDRSTKSTHPKHIHSKPVPRGGGIPIFISLFLTMLLFGSFDSHMAGIFIGAFILMVLGVLDDVMDLSPYLRLFFGVVVAAVVVASGTSIAFVSNPFGGPTILFNNPLLANLVAMLWIVWGMNFVNMGAKGLDGQLPGIVVIAAIVMGILSNRFAIDTVSWPSSFLSFAVAGAYAGLLLFNMYPQKIMPGWGGGAQAGYLLAVLSILSGAKLATALIVLGVPLMDVVYAIIRRLRAGKSPVWGDAEHLHHQLLKLGWSKRQVALFYWLVTAGLGGIALNLNSQMKVYTIFLIAVAVGGILLWINLFLSSNRRA
jgi:UDP-GlcNAc:undecaprenyl-phosphate GlcNAc-1-phosphate transferase